MCIVYHSSEQGTEESYRKEREGGAPTVQFKTLQDMPPTSNKVRASSHQDSAVPAALRLYIARLYITTHLVILTVCHIAKYDITTFLHDVTTSYFGEIIFSNFCKVIATLQLFNFTPLRHNLILKKDPIYIYIYC